MKKTRVSAIAVLILCSALLSPTFAFSAGKVSVTHQSLYVKSSAYVTVPVEKKAEGIINESDIFDAAYLFAEITNTGDKPVAFDEARLELTNEAGEVIGKEDYLWFYPRLLAPGESGYVYEYITADDPSATNSINHYKLTVTGKAENGAPTLRIAAEGVYSQEDRIITANLTNDSADTVWEPRIVYAVFDQNDKLIFSASDPLHYVGLGVGDKVQTRHSVDSDVVDAWAIDGSVPTRVVVIAYIDP